MLHHSLFNKFNFNFFKFKSTSEGGKSYVRTIKTFKLTQNSLSFSGEKEAKRMSEEKPMGEGAVLVIIYTKDLLLLVHRNQTMSMFHVPY